jgi:hypothetical protein
LTAEEGLDSEGGGYHPEGASGLDALLVGYYQGRDLRYTQTTEMMGRDSNL